MTFLLRGSRIIEPVWIRVLVRVGLRVGLRVRDFELDFELKFELESGLYYYKNTKSKIFRYFLTT